MKTRFRWICPRKKEVAQEFKSRLPKDFLATSLLFQGSAQDAQGFPI
nr:MAG TPA: hypothetical protein [Caudoviricetes sp.]